MGTCYLFCICTRSHVYRPLNPETGGRNQCDTYAPMGSSKLDLLFDSHVDANISSRSIVIPVKGQMAQS